MPTMNSTQPGFLDTPECRLLTNPTEFVQAMVQTPQQSLWRPDDVHRYQHLRAVSSKRSEQDPGSSDPLTRSCQKNQPGALKPRAPKTPRPIVTLQDEKTQNHAQLPRTLAGLACPTLPQGREPKAPHAPNVLDNSMVFQDQCCPEGPKASFGSSTPNFLDGRPRPIQSPKDPTEAGAELPILNRRRRPPAPVRPPLGTVG